MAPWRLSAQATVGRYDVFDVEKSVAHDGAEKHRGEVFTFRCPDWCNVIALTEDDELILVYQYRFGTEVIALEVPGGVLDPGEAPLEAARRELLEETGFAAGTIESLGSVHPNPALQGNACHTFVARGCRRVAELAPDPLEELEVVLVPAERIPDLIDEGHVTHALVITGLERYWRTRALGHEKKRR